MDSLTYFIGNQKKKWVWSWGKIWVKLGPMLQKSKKLALSIDIFHILHEEYLLKHKVVVVQTPEWEFKANIARNATGDGLGLKVTKLIII